LAIADFLDATWRNVPISSAKRASPLRKALLLKEALPIGGGSMVTDYAYRALDTRKVAYLPAAIEAGDHRYPVMKHLAIPNIALATTRQLSQGGFSHVLVTRSIADMCLLSTATKECAYVFPLLRLHEDGLLEADSAPTNLSRSAQDFLEQFGGQPNDFLQYAYAILHSPGYRTRYAEFLKIDFPRLPLTSSLELFRELARLGGELVALHLVEAPVQQALSAHYYKAEQAWRYDFAKGQSVPVTVSFNGPEHPVVGKVGWSDDTVWIDAVKSKKGAADAKVTGTAGFRGVPEEVWNFHIGGYQVCEKWLKDHRGRTLTAGDITHYHRIVVALHETIRIMREIDEVIDAHGGWPDAFQSKEDSKGDASEVIEAEPDGELVPAQTARGRREP